VRPALGLVVFVSGCTFLLEYGSRPEICGNERDDDFSGEADCDDPACEGRCPEDMPAACDNGRDDDRDGLFDFADPSCWPLASVTMASCTSVPGTERQLDFDGIDELWAATPGTLREDPTGRFPGMVFGSDPAQGNTTALLLQDTTGAVDGTELHAWVYFDAGHTDFEIRLNVADEPLDSNRARVSWGRGFVQVEGASIELGDMSAMDVGWYELHVEIDETGALIATAERDGAVVGVATTAGEADTWADAHRFSIELAVFPTEESRAPTIVGELEVSRPPLLPCGADVPVRGAETSDFIPRSAAVLRDGALCATGFVGNLDLPPGLARSDDGGRSWTTTRFATGSSFLGFATFLGASVVDGELYTLRVEVGESAQLVHVTDCATIESSEPVTAEATILGLAGYAFDGNHHDFVSRGEEGVLMLWRYSADFMDVVPIPLGRVDVSDSVLINIARVGNDFLVMPDRNPSALWVATSGPRTLGPDHPDRAELREIAVIDAAGAAGACDEQTISDVTLAIDPVPRVEDAAATGALVLRCDTTASSASYVDGLIAYEVVVRRPP
jgi:hypothetical protein